MISGSWSFILLVWVYLMCYFDKRICIAPAGVNMMCAVGMFVVVFWSYLWFWKATPFFNLCMFEVVFDSTCQLIWISCFILLYCSSALSLIGHIYCYYYLKDAYVPVIKRFKWILVIFSMEFFIFCFFRKRRVLIIIYVCFILVLLHFFFIRLPNADLLCYFFPGFPCTSNGCVLCVHRCSVIYQVSFNNLYNLFLFIWLSNYSFYFLIYVSFWSNYIFCFLDIYCRLSYCLVGYLINLFSLLVCLM
jgi:hypothetical protein